MSWMSNEANYDRQLNNYRDEETTKPLPLRVESTKPDEVRKAWFILTYGKKNLKVRDRFFAARTKYLELGKHAKPEFWCPLTM